MPRAEVGSTKYLNNKLKSKGLQRLRWYCQVCEKQCRDENGFKMHTQSESHVRQMLLVGEDPRKYINDFSNQFQRDFLQLLRTAHGEKQVHMNHFYQEYIAHKEHVHMNSTKWPSLTEFAKHLGREGVCRVEDSDKGLHLTWIDNSPEALRRQDAIRKKERQDKGDEERDHALIKDQVARAERHAAEKAGDEADEQPTTILKREEGEKIKLNFGGKPKEIKDPSPPIPSNGDGHDPNLQCEADQQPGHLTPVAASTPPPEKLLTKMSPANKPKNVFATSVKKSAFGRAKPSAKDAPKRAMTEAERIMREEIEQKRVRKTSGFSGPSVKRQKTS
ncbi:MAG: hypothetical protein Q9211_000140 [Gyalolechia sp. 1 TL-2023]